MKETTDMRMIMRQLRTPAARAAAAAMIVLGASSTPMPQPQGARPPQRSATASRESARKTLPAPLAFHAVQVLEPDRPGLAPHVQFTWEPVEGAREYILIGHWATALSWTVQSREFHVTQRSATTWGPHRVSFDAALPQGSHSWRVAALVDSNELGDLATATPITFDLR
jgi:hypothetical protein